MTPFEETEKRFETDIETYLLNHEYVSIPRTEFVKEDALFTDTLIKFIEESQPKAWERYKRRYNDYKSRFISRFKTEVESKGLIATLRYGIEDWGIKFKLIYFKPESNLNEELVDLYKMNIIGVTRQLPYSTHNTNTIDMVLSINGIPLIAFELKNQLRGQSYIDAINQYKSDRDPREYIFKFDTRFLAYFAIDTYDAYMTTELRGDKTRFLPFNQGSNGAGKDGGAGNPANPDGYCTDYIWKIVFQKESFVDLVRRFICRVKETKEVEVNGQMKEITSEKIIFPRYHQYDVVHKIVEDVKDNGSGKNYLIQHSAGSGKSNSIAWLAYRLATLHNEENNAVFDTVVVITDRVVLDSQLQDTINGFEHDPALVEAINDKKRSRGLVEAINDKKRIIICTIQKFVYAYKDFDSLANRKFAIIVDEAHQGQTGDNAVTLRRALIDKEKAIKEYAEEEGVTIEELEQDSESLMNLVSAGAHDNQSFFAFTATPKPKTLEIFGTQDEELHGGKVTKHPFHIYSMRQAIEEGFILDVLKNYVTYQDYFKIVKTTEDNPELIEAQAMKTLIEYQRGQEFTIAAKVKIIMENFIEVGSRRIKNKGKAMVVTSSRPNAVKYYFEIKKYIAEHPQACAHCDALVAFSGEVQLEENGPVYIEAEMNKMPDGTKINSDKRLRSAFRSENFNILVVADKYQTGFDEPLLHSMYVDKKLHGVNAVQTLSRLNRTSADKYDTFVLDFENTKDDIKSSFQKYYKETELEGETDINRVYDYRNKIAEYNLYGLNEINKFFDIRIKEGKKQDEDALGKLTSLFRPVRNSYDSLEDAKKNEYRGLIIKFNNFYSYISSLTRIHDGDLYREYLFTKYLIKLLPKPKVEYFDIDDKIRLEYFELKQTFNGTIALDPETPPMTPPGQKLPSKKEKKKNTFDRIIDKLNDMFGTDFTPAQKVIVEGVFEKFLEDPEIEKYRTLAKSNKEEMFVDTIFPDKFQELLLKLYDDNNEAFNTIFTQGNLYETLGRTMASEFYRMLKEALDKKEDK